MYLHIFQLKSPSPLKIETKTAGTAPVLPVPSSARTGSLKTSKHPQKTPNTPPTLLVRTAPSRTHSEGEHEDNNELTNNIFEHTLDTEHCLYENPDKPQHAYTIDILHDTGASISMLPSDFDFAWTNIRDCLHTISGCLKGTKEKV